MRFKEQKNASLKFVIVSFESIPVISTFVDSVWAADSSGDREYESAFNKPLNGSG